MTTTFNLKQSQFPPAPVAPIDAPPPAAAPSAPTGAAGPTAIEDFQGDQIETAPPPAMPSETPPVEPIFGSAQEVNDALVEWGDMQTAWDALVTHVPQEHEIVLESGNRVNARETLSTGLKQFYEAPPEAIRTREVFANMIYETLPHPEEGEEVGEGVKATYKEYNSTMFEKFIQSSQKEIEKLASEAAKKMKKNTDSFNLSKTAQQKSIENAFLWGPGEKRFDPFYRQPVSDWHMVERNKGFGLTLDDHWNIDWEAIWRGNIMDKYSKPYRDKEGNWVGGYLQKRFEVDKWIPETSNMQLKPGQRRKPRPPEYGVIEGRLQANRAENERGYGPDSDTSEPFNWKNAGSKPDKIAISPGGRFHDPAPSGMNDMDIVQKLDQIEHEIADLHAALAEKEVNEMSAQEEAEMIAGEDVDIDTPLSPEDQAIVERNNQRIRAMDPELFASSKKKIK